MRINLHADPIQDNKKEIEKKQSRLAFRLIQTVKLNKEISQKTRVLREEVPFERFLWDRSRYDFKNTNTMCSQFRCFSHTLESLALCISQLIIASFKAFFNIRSPKPYSRHVEIAYTQLQSAAYSLLGTFSPSKAVLRAAGNGFFGVRSAELHWGSPYFGTYQRSFSFLKG